MFGEEKKECNLNKMMVAVFADFKRIGIDGYILLEIAVNSIGVPDSTCTRICMI